MSIFAMDTLNDFTMPTQRNPVGIQFPRPPEGLRERRGARSVRLEDALYLLLRTARRRLSLKALVLADDLGLLLAEAPSSIDGKELAAWCPLAVGPARACIGQGRVARALTAIMRPHGGGKVRMRRFGNDVGDLYLCSVGRIGRGGLDEVQRSLERILMSAY